MSVIKGLVAATRTHVGSGMIEAWLDYHLSFCERAYVVAHRKTDESMDELGRIFGKHGDRVVWTELVCDMFDDKAMRMLEDLVASGVPAVAVLHSDDDEFIDHIPAVRDVFSRIAKGSHDHAVGWMGCRVGVGCQLYEEDKKTYAEYLKVAPVRSCAIKSAGCSHFKVWMAKWPHLRLHTASAPLSSPDPTMCCLDHFHWTKRLLIKAKEKAFTHMYCGRGYGPWNKAKLEWQAWTGDAEFRKAVIANFQPKSASIHGWFNYPDAYRRICNHLQEGETFVEVGVWQGKSLVYMGEYSALIGKRINIIGYDSFDTGQSMLPREGITSQEWMDLVQGHIDRNCNFNAPSIVQSDSAKAADLHEDGSVGGVWIDAAHDADSVFRDVTAWRKKIRPGGMMAGHDYNHHAVRVGLQRAGLRVSSFSVSSWLAKIDQS